MNENLHYNQNRESDGERLELDHSRIQHGTRGNGGWLVRTLGTQPTFGGVWRGGVA